MAGKTQTGVARQRLDKKICMKCGAVLSVNMVRCRKCRSSKLRAKHKEAKR